MAPLRSLLVLLLLGLFSLSTVFAYPRELEKRAMRNSLVRFGKRSEILEVPRIESAPYNSDRIVYVVDEALVKRFFEDQ